MSSLFNKLGELAQQVAGSEQGRTVREAGSNVLGKISDSVPGGVGGLLGAGALGAILGTLMSGKTAKKVGEGLLVAGGTAAAAGLAWKFYQKWSQKDQTPAPAGSGASPASGWPAELAQNPNQNTTQNLTSTAVSPAQTPIALAAAGDPVALLVLEALVFAIRADGHVDETEHATVHTMMGQLFPGTDVAAHLDTLMSKPIDPDDLARRVVNAEQGRDLYRLSRLVIQVDHSMDRAYLNALAAALGISTDEQAQLEREVVAMQA